ncbi:MAG: hypothetical protein QMB51_03855 [Patescibacteria group bacterium]
MEYKENKDFSELTDEEKKEILNICCDDEPLAHAVMKMDLIDIILKLSNLYTRNGRDHNEAKICAFRIFGIRVKKEKKQ